MRFLLPLLFAINMMALSVDPLLLQAQGSIFPKIMLLDNAISNKIKANRLVLDIVHTDAQTASATKLKSVIDTEYNNRLGDLRFEVRLVNIKDFGAQEDAAAYYVFDASLPSVKKVVSHAKSAQRICFGYNYKDFNDGILISLFVKERTYIYLNKSALHQYAVKFTPIFYRIAKVIE